MYIFDLSWLLFETEQHKLGPFRLYICVTSSQSHVWTYDSYHFVVGGYCVTGLIAERYVCAY